MEDQRNNNKTGGNPPGQYLQNMSPAPPDGDDDYSRPLSALKETDDVDGYDPGQDQNGYDTGQDQNGYDTGQDQSQEEPPEAAFAPDFRALPPEGFSLRALLESALLMGICLVLALLGLYLPLIAQFLYPLPLALLVLRRGVRAGVWSTAALFALSVPLLGLPQAVLLLAQCSLLGLFLGYCFRRGRRPLFTLCVATVISALGALLNLIISMRLAGLPLDGFAQLAADFVDQTFAAMTAQGQGLPAMPDNITPEQLRAQLIGLLTNLLPGAVVVSAMAVTGACYLLAVRVLRRLRYDLPACPPFADWRVDWRLSWAVIVGLICLLLGKYLASAPLHVIGMNILYVVGAILFVAGIAFYVWNMKFFAVGRWGRLFLVFAAVLFIQSFMWFFILIAIIEPLFDLRGRIGRMKSNG